MYDSRIGRWLGPDPKGQFASPYEGMGNNPVTGSDQAGGEWHPDANGNLVADAGDNASTLADYLSISASSAQSLFANISNWDNGALQHQRISGDPAGHFLSSSASLGNSVTLGGQLSHVAPSNQGSISQFNS
jgi:hypothetical protein